MAVRTMGHEIDAGRRRLVRRHAARVDAFVRPQRSSERPKASSPTRETYPDARTEARRGDHHVRRVAAETALVGVGIPGARRIELDHRLADGHDLRSSGRVGHCGPAAFAGRLGSARNAAAYAAAAERTCSTVAPGW